MRAESAGSAPAQAAPSARPAAPAVAAEPVPALPVGQPLREVERQLILKTLETVGGNRVRAAEILGISPKTLYNKLGRYNAQSEPQRRETEPAEEV